MAHLTVTKLDEDVYRRLRVRAFENGRSLEAEARVLLGEALADQSLDNEAAADEAAHRSALKALEEIQTALKAANGGEIPAGMVDDFIAQRRAESAAELRRMDEEYGPERKD